MIKTENVIYAFKLSLALFSPQSIEQVYSCGIQICILRMCVGGGGCKNGKKILLSKSLNLLMRKIKN